MFRRIQAEGAEFVDSLWLLAHNRFATPSIKGSATPERKYPEYPHHAATGVDHRASNQPKFQRHLAPDGSTLGWLAARPSGRQSALETNHSRCWQSRCNFHHVTTSDKLPAAEIIPSTFGFLDRRASICLAKRLQGQQCSAHPATSGDRTTLRNRATWKPGVYSGRAGG